jgi:hypothetical protein
MRGLSYKKARFYTSAGAVYALTLVFLLSSLNIGMFRKTPVYANAQPYQPVSIIKALVITAGKPVEIVFPQLGLDLPVDDGNYDIANQTWTLSGYRAQFALPSVVPNDYQGNTLIYGHNNMKVFGKLRDLQPGDTMQLITNNHLTFNYSYRSYRDVQPDDLSVFKYDGPPTVTVQTCTGSWNEIRRLYEFKFVKVENS